MTKKIISIAFQDSNYLPRTIAKLLLQPVCSVIELAAKKKQRLRNKRTTISPLFVFVFPFSSIIYLSIVICDRSRRGLRDRRVAVEGGRDAAAAPSKGEAGGGLAAAQADKFFVQ